MNPAQAIKAECRSCINAAQANCTTAVCKLHPAVFKCRSSVKRIRAHCLECAAQDLNETKYQAVTNCTGRLLRENGNAVRWTAQDGGEGGVCYLHPYRSGKNPNRPKRTSTPSQFASRTTGQTRFPPPGSTITTSGVLEVVR